MTSAHGRGMADNGEPLGGGGFEGHEYAMWDAAYVLGSLSAGDRREFEVHMGGCASCRQAVTELAGVPTLLSLLDHDEVAAIDEGIHVSVTPPPDRKSVV